MHAERDYLVKKVFPQLAEWCENRKLRLVDIDLRWGVTEQDALYNKNVVKVCLDRINTCRPFFLCFLGQRRGSVPKEKDISQETYQDFPDLKPYAGNSSITEMEILHALISPMHKSKERDPEKSEEYYEKAKHAFFYLRNPSYLLDLPKDPNKLREIYTNEGINDKNEREIADKELKEWREVKIKNLNRPIHHYTARWNPQASTPEISIPLQCPSTAQVSIERWQREWQKVGINADCETLENNPIATEKATAFNEKLCSGRLTDFKVGNDSLSKVILEDLKAAIISRYPEHNEIESNLELKEKIAPELRREIEQKEILQKELDQQEQFFFLNSEGFIGRQGDFADLDDYVKGDSTKLFVLTAPGGMGKSMLLANWIDHYPKEIGLQTDQTFHYRFIGASDKSTAIYSLLSFLLQEIKEAAHKLDDPVPDEPKKLLEALPKLLENIGKHGKTVIVLDALNQLESGLSELGWLPWSLPPNIKMIVSFKRGEPAAEELYSRFQASNEVTLSEVRPFENLEDRSKLVRVYLSQFLKDIDEKHLEVLKQSPGANNPLYLKIVLSELRVFGAFSNIEKKIRDDFGHTPISAFNGVLKRLETDPTYSLIAPKQAVPLLFGLLAHARHGLSAQELTSIIIQTLKLSETIKENEAVADAVYLFLRQIRPFLAHREGRFDFFYESLKLATIERYMDKTTDAVLFKMPSEDWHRILAKYFSSLPTWQNKDTEAEQAAKKIPMVRKVSELPYHLTLGRDWTELEATLTDLDFLKSKCIAKMTYDLIADYKLALDALPENEENNQIEAKRQERLKKYTEDFIAFARGEIKTLDIIPSIELWSPRKISEERARILSQPTRFEHIRSFYLFINAESHKLQKFVSYPGFLLQQAYNYSNSGPLADTCKEHLRNEESRFLFLQESFQIPEYNPYPALLKTLESTGRINFLSCTFDGKTAISGNTEEEILQVWDLESGECKKTLKIHDSWVEGLCSTPDGKLAVSTSRDGTLRVWDLESGECKKTLKIHDSYCYLKGLCCTPDGKLAISRSENRLHVYDLTNGELKKILPATDSIITDLYCNSNGKFAVSAHWDGTLRVWDLETGECKKTLTGHTKSVTCICCTPDGKLVISASYLDTTLRAWDLETGKCKKTLAHKNGVDSVCCTHDGRLVISASGGALRVWDLESGECKKTLTGHADRLVRCTPDGKLVISISMKGDILGVWDLEKGDFAEEPTKHSENIDTICCTNDGRKAISGSTNGNILRVWDLESGECKKTLTGHTRGIKNTCCSPDGKLVISSSFDSTLRVWDLESGECKKTLTGHADKRLVCCSPDGKLAISGSDFGTLSVWDLDTGEYKKTLQSKRNQILYWSYLCCSPDCKFVISSNKEAFNFWDLKTGEYKKTIGIRDNWYHGVKTGEKHTNDVNCSCCSPDGKLAISGSDDGTLRVWDLETGECKKTLTGHTKSVTCICCTPDGKLVISASYLDTTLRAWDLETGKTVSVYQANNNPTSLAIGSQDRLVFGDNQGKIVIFKMRIFNSHFPIITPVRLWRFEKNNESGHWDDKITAICTWCGQRFDLQDQIICQIHSASFGTIPSNEAYLNSFCPLCKKPVIFNPFIVDNKDPENTCTQTIENALFKKADNSQRPHKRPEIIEEKKTEMSKTEKQSRWKKLFKL